MYLLRKISIFLAIPLLFASCIKDEVGAEIDKYKKIDEAAIEKLNTDQNLGLAKNEDGVYFKKIVENPTGRVLNFQVTVGLVFTLKTFDGTVLQEASPADSAIFNFYNSRAFDGFLSAMVTLKEGEKGLFYIPSYLAYQNQPISGLQAWEPVILELEIPRIYNEEEQILAYYEKAQVVPDTTTEEGLRARFLTTVPDGEPALGKQNVSVRYSGSFLTGTEFDSGSFDVALGVSSVVPGFEEAILLMRVGEKAEFVFPSILGYAERGSGQSIPPYTPLKFEIELMAINN